MTKYEMLRHDEKGNPLSDFEIFDLELAALRYRLNSLHNSILTGLFKSRIWSYSQRQAQEKLCAELEKLFNLMKNWSFYGDQRQVELDFDHE